MANHGYGYLEREATKEEIDVLLRAYAEKRFPGMLRIEFDPNADYHWSIFILLPGFEDDCMEFWLEKPDQFEWRHGCSDRLVGYLKGALAEHVVKSIGGLIGDDAYEERNAPDFETRNPTFYAYFSRFFLTNTLWAVHRRDSAWREYSRHLGKDAVDILDTPAEAA